MSDEPRVIWNEESETFKIIVGDIFVFVPFEANENDTFDWFKKEENTINKKQIELDGEDE